MTSATARLGNLKLCKYVIDVGVKIDTLRCNRSLAKQWRLAAEFKPSTPGTQ